MRDSLSPHSTKFLVTQQFFVKPLLPASSVPSHSEPSIFANPSVATYFSAGPRDYRLKKSAAASHPSGFLYWKWFPVTAGFDSLTFRFPTLKNLSFLLTLLTAFISAKVGNYIPRIPSRSTQCGPSTILNAPATV